jgi:hypothetical protein
MNVLEIIFSAWAYIEVTCCVPFLKSYEPVIEVAKLIFALHSRGYDFLKEYTTCDFHADSQKMSFLTNFM